MSNFKKKIKQDLISKTGVQFSYDKELYYEPVEHKHLKKRLIIGFSVFGVILISMGSVPFLASLKTTSSIQILQKNYSLNELKDIESSTFKSLNQIQYKVNEKYEVSKNYQESISDFSYKVYQQIANKKDISFSPMGLYSLLFLCSLGSNDSQIINEFESILNLKVSQIKQEYNEMYLNDLISNDMGTMQMYNGMFLSNDFSINQSYLSELTKYYCEAYSLDFKNSNDIQKIISWCNQKMRDEQFISLKELQFSKDLAFTLWNTLYFDCKWQHTFSTSKTYQDYFETIQNKNVLTSFMSHTYYGDLYDYKDYISCYDYYQNGFKIQYLISKNNLNIHEVLNHQNFLKEDENKILKNKIIELSVPKFSKESLIDFTNILKDLGMNNCFDTHYPAFNYMFENLDESTTIYLTLVQQKNKIVLNEDGTVVKSLTMAYGDKATSLPPTDTYSICLNKPFIYVIYDQNQLPVYIGNIDTL